MIGKISDEINECMWNDILSTEIKQALKAMKLNIIGGPDGITSRSLNYLGGMSLHLIHGAIRELRLQEKKPSALSASFWTFNEIINL